MLEVAFVEIRKLHMDTEFSEALRKPDALGGSRTRAETV